MIALVEQPRSLAASLRSMVGYLYVHDHHEDIGTVTAAADEIERLNVYRGYVRKSFVAMCGEDCVHEHHNLPRLIRELKAENEKLQAENAVLRAEGKRDGFPFPQPGETP
jgi:hypothetical protein